MEKTRKRSKKEGKGRTKKGRREEQKGKRRREKRNADCQTGLRIRVGRGSVEGTCAWWSDSRNIRVGVGRRRSQIMEAESGEC